MITTLSPIPGQDCPPPNKHFLLKTLADAVNCGKLNLGLFALMNWLKFPHKS